MPSLQNDAVRRKRHDHDHVVWCMEILLLLVREDFGCEFWCLPSVLYDERLEREKETSASK